MNNIQLFICIMMLFCHIVDDFYLQGILAKMKQKSWWEENAPDKLYKNDYLTALIIHALSWSIMICLPLMCYTVINNINNGMVFMSIAIIGNMIIHAVVDNLKANLHIINLHQDRLVHFIQIIVTFSLYNVMVTQII